MIFQHFNLLSSRTVAANVAYPLEIGGVHSRGEIARTVERLLERVGLSSLAKSYPRQLSGGQKQRVGIARALATSPSVLLCDEATSALDPQSTTSILDLLREINRDLGMTIVTITHEMDVVRRICDRVAVLDHGRVAETGPVADVFLNPVHPATLRILEENSGTSAGKSPPQGEVVLTLFGEQAQSTLVSRILRRHRVDFAIVSGRVGTIGQAPFLQLVMKLEGGERDAVLLSLRQEGIRVEELNQVLPGHTQQGGLLVA
jgi:D-methionine transport system ATP-binding protein